MVIITRSSSNLSNDIVNLDEDPNKKGADEQVRKKRKHLYKSNEYITIPNKPSVKKLGVVEEKAEGKEIPQAIIDNASISEDCTIVLKP